MPSLGADMEAGTLVEWRIKPGDHVKRGDIIAVVETQKGAVEVDFWQEGTVEEIVVPLWQKVPVGTLLAKLREDGAPAAPLPPAPAPAAREAEAAPARVRASPSARQLARELGIDLATLAGTGPSGAITHDDVEKAATARKAAAAAPALPRLEVDRAAAMRQAIAAAMARSKREIPHYYLSTTIDLSRMSKWLEAENAKRPITERVLPVVPLLRATALALREVPELNGYWVEGGFRRSEAIHLGFAISFRGGGLVAPALHDADKRTTPELMRDLTDLIKRARAGSIRSSELTDPTITVTNLGDQGVEAVFGIIYPPQVALVGFGKIAERPWAAGGMVGARPTVVASLAADHRASDGHRGGIFLTALDRLLQEPEKL